MDQPSDQTGKSARPAPGNESRLQLLLDSLTDEAICMLDPEGRVVSWSAVAERMLGYAAGEILGQHVSVFLGADDRKADAANAVLAQATQSDRAESEGWRVRKSGERFWSKEITTAVRNERGGLIGFARIARETSEPDLARQHLAESERRFGYLVKCVIDYAIYMLDLNGVVTDWNAGAERLKGYTAEEIIGRHFGQFYVREDRLSGVPVRALDIAARDGRHESEGWCIRKDGSRFWASVVIDAVHDTDGKLIGYAKITRDISERRAAEEILRESERQFRLLVAGVTDYALFMLDPNGIVTNWNLGAERIKGYSAREIVGQHFSRFYTEPDRAAGAPARALQTARTEGRFEAEGWRVRKDGSWFWANAVIDAIRDETGTLVGFAKITRDITERRNHQEAMQRAQEQLAQAQKMEALGQFTGGIAHDFNNLLMIVSGHAQSLRRRSTEPRDQRALDAILLAASRGATLTRHLLSFARRQPLRIEPIRVSERVEVFHSLLASTLRETIKFESRLAPDAWTVEIDTGEFELALLNLAVNARDAMPEGGTLTLSVENVVLDGRRDPTTLAGEFVAIALRDTGIGIPPDVLPRIFEPFFTTKQVDKGTGLGLSQVYGFVQQAGGDIRVDSQVGRGTTFTLYLPRSRKIPSAPPVSDPDLAGAKSAGIALLVEDNPEVANVVSSILGDLRYNVLHAANAAAGLEILRGGGHFAALVSDIVMPGDMDGIELARAVRREFPAIPILLISGYSKASEQAEGQFPILRKPFDQNGLATALQEARARRGVEPPFKLVNFADALKDRNGKTRKDG